LPIGDWIAKNAASLMALAAIGTVLVNLLLAYLKRKNDSAEETSKRIDAQAKIVSTSLTLLVPLEKRVNDLEKDNTKFKELADKQADQIAKVQDQNDFLSAKLRAIEADRNNLLQRVLNLQNENGQHRVLITQLQADLTAQADENARQRVTIARLETELDQLRDKNREDESIDDRSQSPNSE